MHKGVNGGGESQVHSHFPPPSHLGTRKLYNCFSINLQVSNKKFFFTFFIKNFIFILQ